MDKIKASIYYASYLDTLGFNNGIWEFNFGTEIIESKIKAIRYWWEIVKQYNLSGGRNINLSKKKSSDDTILMIATAEACLNGAKKKDFINSFLKYKKEIDKTSRASGLLTMEMLNYLKKNKEIPYFSRAGGCGAAMRTSPIGLIFHKKVDIKKLISVSIESSRLTHNYPLGFLGGLVNALFTSYAIQNKPIIDWCDSLLKLNESGLIDKYMKTTDISDNYQENKDEFWDKWYQYREKRLNKLDLENILTINIIDEMVTKDYSPQVFGKSETNYSKWGSNGCDSVIIAYDALILSQGSWDSLVFNAALHFGDNDTTGTIAGAWYGAYYGFKEFGENNIKKIEFYHKLKEISDKIIAIH